MHVHRAVVVRSPGIWKFDFNCASCGCGPEPRDGASILNVHLVAWPGAPGRGVDLNCASCARGVEPRKEASILLGHLAVAVRSPGKGLRSQMCIWWSFPEAPGRRFDLSCASCGRGGPEPREGASILHVHLAVVVRSPGKRASILQLRSYMCILWLWSGAPGRGFDLKCASSGRGPERQEGASILNVHLVIVVGSPRGVSILFQCASCGRSGAPGRGFDLLSISATITMAPLP